MSIAMGVDVGTAPARVQGNVAAPARVLNGHEVALSALAPGEDAVVIELDRGDTLRLHKLLSLGILPGVRLSVRRTYPCFVLQVGFAQLALDAPAADSIRVRRDGQVLRRP